MKKIAFWDEGPTRKYENEYTGGDIIEVVDNVANAYIEAKLAFEVKTKTDENKAQGIKEQVGRNEERRKLVPKASKESVEAIRTKLATSGVTV